MNFYLIFILGILIFQYLLDIITGVLNLKSLKNELPKEFEGTYNAEKYAQSQKYTRENTRFSFLTSTITLTAMIIFIFLGGFNYADTIARSLGAGSVFTGLVFIGILLLASTLLSLPFDIYATFVIEEKYGFNKTTVKTFILDFIKNILLTAIIGGVILTAILWFFESAGDLAWLYSWIGVLIFTVFMQFLAPVVIMPLFNKFIPLPDGELKDAIYYYANQQNFKIKGIFTMDGSKRSTKLNAFFTGFGKFKRIVFYDTLIEKLTTEEIVAVLAHEMGHYKLKHIQKGIILSILSTGLMFFILSLFVNNSALFAAFKMDHISIYASLLFFMFIYSPINMILDIAGNILSRKHEYQADAYSAQTTKKPESLISSLKKLSVFNLSNLTPHPLNIFLNYSHPPVLKRIESLKKF